MAPYVPVPLASAVLPPPAPQVIEVKPTIIVQPAQLPEINVNDELDAFYARLAKVQLEKRQLDNALALVEKIKSETFKVRTVVDLAEYVSRDKNYQSEAEKLYRLALAGMEALDKGQPFRIDTGAKVVVPPAVPYVVPQPEPVRLLEPLKPSVVAEPVDEPVLPEPVVPPPLRPAIVPQPLIETDYPPAPPPAVVPPPRRGRL
jgi:hypothetical protein